MIEKYTWHKLFADVLYIGSISISKNPVEVDLHEKSEKYATRKALSHKQSCMLSHARYVNSPKI